MAATGTDVFLHLVGRGGIEAVHRFAALEVDVGVLGRPAQHRPVGGQGPLAVGTDVLLGDEGAQQLIVDGLHLLNLMGGAEAVEHVQERQARAQAGAGGDGGKVAGLLHRGRAEHGTAGAAGGHHIAVVSEDRQALRRRRA